MTVRTATDVPDAGSQSAPVLCVEGVTKRWPTVTAPVLEDVDLAVQPGAAVGIVGRNGAGKTTLLRIAAGLLAPDSGRVRISGFSPNSQRTECQRRIGLASAGNSGLYGRLGVRAHLELWARLALISRPARSAAIERALDDFALREFGNRRVDRMSMGQRQRLRLALAVLHDPELLLLDEPRTSLDTEAWQLATDAISAARARGAAALVCFPSGEEDPLDFDEVYEVREGRLVPR
jgi:ABC-2 type transport system ATP-binding protein